MDIDPTMASDSPAELAAEIKRLNHEDFRVGTDASKSALHAAIERMAEALRISRQSEREAWRYKDELEADRDRLAALASAPRAAAAYVEPLTIRRLEEARSLGADAIGTFLMINPTATSVPLYVDPVAAQQADSMCTGCACLAQCGDVYAHAAEAAELALADAMTLQEVWDRAGGAHSMDNPTRHDVEMLLHELDAMKGVPRGWQLVPIEPEDEMLVAGQEAGIRESANRNAVEDCKEAEAVYRSMLAVAPAAPTITLPTAQAVDAARWAWLRAQHEGTDDLQFDAEGLPMPIEPTALAWTVFRPVADSLEPVGSLPGELDATIDAEMSATAGGEKGA